MKGVWIQQECSAKSKLRSGLFARLELKESA
jgi:hypothetical protein